MLVDSIIKRFSAINTISACYFSCCLMLVSENASAERVQKVDAEMIHIMGNYYKRPIVKKAPSDKPPIRESIDRIDYPVFEDTKEPLNGHTIYTYGNGSVCDCDFVDGKPHGQGHIKWTDGTVYQGELADGVIDGKGSYQYTDGSSLSGQLVNGNLQGFGRHVLANGDKFEGEFENNHRVGPGVLTLKNGDTLTGTFVNDNPIKGVIKYKNKNGVPEVYYGGIGSSSTGFFFEGIGVLSSPTRGDYIGGWDKGLPAGWGVSFTFLGTGTYRGPWRKGKPHGFGSAITKRKNYVIRTNWVDGVPNGDIIVFIPGKGEYEGKFINGKIKPNQKPVKLSKKPIPFATIELNGAKYILSTLTAEQLNEYETGAAQLRIGAGIFAAMNLKNYFKVITKLEGGVVQLVRIGKFNSDRFVNGLKAYDDASLTLLKKLCQFNMLSHPLNSDDFKFWKAMNDQIKVRRREIRNQ